MVCRLSHLLTPRRNGFALIPALAAVAVLAAPAASASAASPLTGETLAGTATTTNGGGRAIPSCINHGLAGASATFNASGEATGPYPGSFVENQGSASLSETVMHNQLSADSISVPFTITTGATTITGTISHSQFSRYPNLNGFGFLCAGATVVGLSVNTTATYTATIQAPGQTPQAISGQAQVFGSLYTQPGAQTSLTASFTG
ncbi:MAG TPA: hypothetical protein VEF89_15905 [Solirubrobacteraceae bacterium]|nr:hypothetical protein [Solirubrobacteraceae bacterium]